LKIEEEKKKKSWRPPRGICFCRVVGTTAAHRKGDRTGSVEKCRKKGKGCLATIGRQYQKKRCSVTMGSILRERRFRSLLRSFQLRGKEKFSLEDNKKNWIRSATGAEKVKTIFDVAKTSPQSEKKSKKQLHRRRGSVMSLQEGLQVKDPFCAVIQILRRGKKSHLEEKKNRLLGRTLTDRLGRLGQTEYSANLTIQEG